MSAGRTQTWSAKKRESVAGPVTSPPNREVRHRRPHERRVGADLYPDHSSPEAVLIPPEHVPRERYGQSQQQQGNAEHPVDLPRGLVGAAQEHLDHVGAPRTASRKLADQ